MKKRIEILLIIIICLSIAACVTMSPVERAGAERGAQLDRVLSSPGYSTVAATYDSKYGAGSFRQLVVQQGLDVWQDEGKDINPIEAYNRAVFIQPGATDAALLELNKLCAQGIQGPCDTSAILTKLQKNRKECSNENGKSCLNVALAYQRNGFSRRAKNVAQTACAYKEQSGCTLYDQLVGEQKNQENIRAEQVAEAQQANMQELQIQNQKLQNFQIIQGMEIQNNQQMENSLQNLSNAWSRNPH